MTTVLRRATRDALLAALAAAALSPAAGAQAFFLRLSPAQAAGMSRPGAVGLEALGIAPDVALRYAGRLDVRDALGRPVSARLIERQVGAASRASADSAAYASSLPAFRRVLKLLEALVFHSAVLSSGPGPKPSHAHAALPWTLKAAGRVAASAVIVLPVPGGGDILRLAAAVLLPDSVSQRSDVLRL